MSGVTQAHVTRALTGLHAPVQRGELCGVTSFKRGAPTKASRVVSAGGSCATQMYGGRGACTPLVCLCMEVPRAARSPTSPRCTGMRACKAPPWTGAFFTLAVPPGVLALLKSSESVARLAPCCAAALQRLNSRCAATGLIASAKKYGSNFRYQQSSTDP